MHEETEVLLGPQDSKVSQVRLVHLEHQDQRVDEDFQDQRVIKATLDLQDPQEKLDLKAKLVCVDQRDLEEKKAKRVMLDFQEPQVDLENLVIKAHLVIQALLDHLEYTE